MKKLIDFSTVYLLRQKTIANNSTEVSSVLFSSPLQLEVNFEVINKFMFYLPGNDLVIFVPKSNSIDH